MSRDQFAELWTPGSVSPLDCNLQKIRCLLAYRSARTFSERERIHFSTRSRSLLLATLELRDWEISFSRNSEPFP